MGDPETQSIMTRLGADFADVLIAAAEGNLSAGPTINDNFVCTVVLASGGYPANFQKGYPIGGIANINSEHTTVFHAGTAINENGELVNVGGRVLAVTSSGATAEEARASAQAEAAKLEWEGRYFRTDIGG
jgi:phosphoribosylamine--glycine ligase